MADSTPSNPTTVMQEEPVQFEAFEGSKENIQPSRTGHNPHKLLHSLAHQSNTTNPTLNNETLLATQRTALEQAILNYTGADPLLPYLHYIDWTLTSYPSLAPHSSLLPLLEKATRTFLSSPGYHSDKRYVRLWLLYADRCPHPADIYAFMSHHGIGRTVSVYHVAHSRYVELMGRYQQAEDVLQLGVVCKAVPRNTVEIAMRQLKARNEVRVRREVELMAAQRLDPLSDVVLNAMSDAPQRQVLSQLQQADKENVAVSLLQQRPTAAAQQSITSFRRPVVAAVHAPIRPASTAQTSIQIYTDSSTPANSLPLPAATPNWRTLPTRAAADKENTLTATTWNAPLLKPQHTDTVAAVAQQRVRQQQPKYVVYKDEECERLEKEQEAGREKSERVERERQEKVAGMRRRMEAAQATAHNKLTLDPLRNINKKAAASAQATVATPSATSDVSKPTTAPRVSRPVLSGLTVSLNASTGARPSPPAPPALNARLQSHRLALAPGR